MEGVNSTKLGRNVGVELRKWEKYMPVGGMIQVKRFKLRNVIIIMLTRYIVDKIFLRSQEPEQNLKNNGEQ